MELLHRWKGNREWSTFLKTGPPKRTLYTEGFFTSYKIFFSALKKKLTVNFFQKCTQLKLAPVPGSARNLRKSYRGIFEKTPYMYSMGVLADIVFFLDFSMVNH